MSIKNYVNAYVSSCLENKRLEQELYQAIDNKIECEVRSAVEEKNRNIERLEVCGNCQHWDNLDHICDIEKNTQLSRIYSCKNWQTHEDLLPF